MGTHGAPAANDLAELLRQWLAEQTFGSLHPIEVTVSRDLDSDDREAWFFVVLLPDPPKGKDTWPVDEINKLLLATRDKALEIGLDWPWYVRFRPETDEPPEEPAVEDPA